MKKKCKICGKEFEASNNYEYLCGYGCRKEKSKELEAGRKKRREAPKTFSLEYDPYELGLIKMHKDYYEELKPFQI